MTEINDLTKVVHEIKDTNTFAEIDQVVSLVPRTVKNLLRGLTMWNMRIEYKVEELEMDLQKRLKNVSPDQIIDPPAYVVVPALQAMSYSMDSDELRSMYANLIAKSMIIDSKDLVHPGFVDDIKQMAPYDAVLLRLIASRPNNPLVDVKFVTKGLEFHPVKEKVMYFDNPLFDESRTPIALDNLIRLGIVSIPFGDHYVDDAHYAPLVVNKYGLPSKSDDKSAPHIEFDKKIVKITNYGKLFCQICIS